jgi:hypothetical protein
MTKRAIQQLLKDQKEIWISRQVLREYAAVLTRDQPYTTALTGVLVAIQLKKFETNYQIAEDNAAVTAELRRILQTTAAVVYQGWSPEWGEYVGMVSVDTGAHRVLYQADAMTAFDLSPMENTFAVITDDGNGVNRLCMAAIDTPAALTCPAEGNYAAVNVQFGNNG